ncbi:sulfotransferase family protein [Sulfitobacter albidus]|uniref:Sulfotransferase family protein n=1 Tax=Sulfitobacter albidus TaxID=2829501 RepID=A0A975PNH9_9RHOB|nr:sulfotransferase family protein [Sulfitobacter albidus]QUJ77868.1 sulfotransferase family protein [Sulfitobacter albidus]
MSTLRIVNLGLPKTGTTTLARALKIAGLRVADHRIRPRQTTNADLSDAYVADLLYRGYFQTGDPGALFDDFTALTELSCLRGGKSLWPQMDFAIIDAIRKHHPGVRFLASRRDSWDVSQSMLAWSDLGIDRLPASDIPGLPQGYGETTRERIQWIDGHYAHLRAIFAGDPAYLEYDVADAGARDAVATHIGTDLTWWGAANTNNRAG